MSSQAYWRYGISGISLSFSPTRARTARQHPAQHVSTQPQCGLIPQSQRAETCTLRSVKMLQSEAGGGRCVTGSSQGRPTSGRLAGLGTGGLKHGAARRDKAGNIPKSRLLKVFLMAFSRRGGHTPAHPPGFVVPASLGDGFSKALQDLAVNEQSQRSQLHGNPHSAHSYHRKHKPR